MDVDKYTVKETDFNGKGVSSQPNPMELPEDQAKAIFDQLVKEVMTPKFNAFVRAFINVDLTSDKEKPISEKVMDALNKKVDKEKKNGSDTEYKVLSDNNFSDQQVNALMDANGKKHTHDNKNVLDSIAETDVYNWRDANEKKHTHENKTALDSITQTDVYNWRDANEKKHTHENKTALDSITQTDVDNWRDANGKKHTHENKTALDSITQTDVDNWIDANGKKHMHDNKNVLDSITQTDVDNWRDANGKKHMHDNKNVLDSITQTDVYNWRDANEKKHTHDNKNVLDSIRQTDVDNWNNGLIIMDRYGNQLPKRHFLQFSNSNVFDNGAKIVVEGIKGDKGDSPVKGTDYWTEADKAEMVNDVLAELPTTEGVSY